METQASLLRKLNGAKDLKSVVRSMKAISASNIGQFELAVSSLGEYYQAVSLGIIAYFNQEKIDNLNEKISQQGKGDKSILAIVFGSDQGLVGKFNDSLTEFVAKSISEIPVNKEIWAVGERVQLLLSDIDYNVTSLFAVPNSVNAITPLVQQIFVKSEESFDKRHASEVYIFHNKPKSGATFEATIQRILPLDEKWRQSLTVLKWPTKSIPEVIGGIKPTLVALIHAYLFTTFFKSCAESLASENASRLAAMQRAEKNIDELLDDLNHKFHSLRQSSIDEELFDVVSGYEVMKDD